VIIYDKTQLVKTLGNTPSSPVTGFSEQRSILFNGKVAVTNGLFNCSFILPKDIRFAPGFGSISLYASNGVSDAAGATPVGISGFAAAIPSDTKGPDIRLFLNDTLFMNGGLSNESPVLIAHLSDSSGINATGNSIGHDITLVIDGAINNQLVLNNAFSYRTNSYQAGQLQFQLPVLLPGKHSLKLKAWDVLNNSNEASLDFWIAPQEKLTISAVRNFPNPFAGSTQFSVEHNQRNTNLFVEIFISDSQGRLVKHLSERVNSSGSRNVQLRWNGDTDSGRKLSRGTYFYRIIVSTTTQQVQHAGQLLLL
ncbi:MAG: FlgD immunoglobulin-like domain containing protein, partial [Sediminibacterium sp.]|nr:FlgD immunoglobulin-like domain containing protein [Sediminibacterium sp.]